MDIYARSDGASDGFKDRAGTSNIDHRIDLWTEMARQVEHRLDPWTERARRNATSDRLMDRDGTSDRASMNPRTERARR